MAGLAAALQLEDFGFDVTVVEARFVIYARSPTRIV
jgi:uncharacterized protein with NAD-binding domain and iron-sulfur cluster